MESNNGIGALWLNESKSGTKYMSGVIEVDGQKIKVVVFRNKYKEEGDNKPDYRILKSEEQQQSAPATSASPAPAVGSAFQDDVPF